MNLIIVESPTKAKTISKFVGSKYTVESSFGHVRDLPKGNLGIDPEHNFEPHYVIPRKAQKQVTALRKKVLKAAKLILATDEDREGEAIAWHLAEVLGAKNKNGKGEAPPLPPTERIVFHEITKGAIEAALEHPRAIDRNLVDAQQSRRVLDRLVGYKLSPFLWKKIARGLSAGRVQSVALRLIIDREEEIKKFIIEQYYTIAAQLKPEKAGGAKSFTANLTRIGNTPVPKPGIKTKEEAETIVKHLKVASYRILSVDRKETKRNPLPPFTTSTLQQTAARHFGFSSKKTMFLAQQLYENGYITYMRTDSLNLSKEALQEAAVWIARELGDRYAGSSRTFTTKSKNAQEAHEAIRPTTVDVEAKSVKLEKDHRRIYDLIWKRFVASQLPPAVFDATRIEIEATPKKGGESYILSANGTILKFDGFFKVWPIKFEEKELPELREGGALTLESVNSEEHATEPPPRYSEATLIKTLEQHGIGRPSTYAPTISVIQERNYVEKNQGRFFSTEIGSLVNKVLTENFPEIVDIQFTAKMEDELDGIARGESQWQNVIREFYEPFAVHLEKKYEEVSKESVVEEKTDLVCEKCGRPMIVKFGRFGKFAACSGYPECKNTKALKNPPREIGMKCPTCGEGEVIERRVSKKGRARGKLFWGCSRYPKCTYASWTNPLEGDKKNVPEKAEAS